MVRVHLGLPLTFFEKKVSKETSRNGRGDKQNPIKWGCSSAGRAPALQAGGHGFESHHLHHKRSEIENPSMKFLWLPFFTKKVTLPFFTKKVTQMFIENRIKKKETKQIVVMT